MARLEAQLATTGPRDPVVEAMQMAASLSRIHFPLEANSRVTTELGLSPETVSNMTASYTIKLEDISGEDAEQANIVPTGIRLRNMMIGETMYTIGENDTLFYQPWSTGLQVAGAGQIGVYRVRSQQDGVEHTSFMVVRDWHKNDDWAVYVEEIADTEQELADKLLPRTELITGTIGLARYVLDHLVASPETPATAAA